MCVQIKLCTSVNARQPADSWKLGTAILLSGLLHVVIFLSTSLVPLATPTKFQPRKVVLEALRRALAAGHTDGQNSQRLIFLLNTSQAVSVLGVCFVQLPFFPSKTSGYHRFRFWQEEAELLAKRASEDPNWAGCVGGQEVISRYSSEGA